MGVMKPLLGLLLILVLFLQFYKRRLVTRLGKTRFSLCSVRVSASAFLWNVILVSLVLNWVDGGQKENDRGQNGALLAIPGLLRHCTTALNMRCGETYLRPRSRRCPKRSLWLWSRTIFAHSSSLLHFICIPYVRWVEVVEGELKMCWGFWGSNDLRSALMRKGSKKGQYGRCAINYSLLPVVGRDRLLLTRRQRPQLPQRRRRQRPCARPDLRPKALVTLRYCAQLPFHFPPLSSTGNCHSGSTCSVTP